MTRRIAAALSFLVASPVYAEVMDKEMSVLDIWRSTIVVVVLAGVAALLNRWLLLLSFCIAIVIGPTFAWTEWYDEFAGPAILHEAGASYGLHANGAMSIVVLTHVVCWTFAWLRRRRRLLVAGRWSPALAKRSVVQTAVFMGLVSLLTALAGSSGFGGGSGIWLSLPFFLATICGMIAIGLAAQTHFRRGAEVA